MIEEVVSILQKSDSEYQQIGFLILRKIESYEIELKVDSKHPNAEFLKEIVLNSNINREFSNGNELKRLEIWKSINFNLVSEGYVLENVSNLHPSVKVALQIREPDFIVDQKQQDCSIEIAREIYNLAKNGLSKPVLEIIEKINIEINSSNYNNAFLVLEEAYESGLLQFNPEIELLEKIKIISLLYLSEEQIIKLFKIKFYLASKLNCFDLIEDDAKAFLQKYKDSVDEKSYHNIILARAGAALQKGKTESAQALYKQLLNKKTQ